MENKVQLHKPQPIDIAIALVGIAMAIITFIKIPQAFILEALLIMITAVYMLACVGFFDDDTDNKIRKKVNDYEF